MRSDFSSNMHFNNIKSEEGSCVHSLRGVSKCIPVWYNDKKLWSGGYNLSGSKLNLWINTHGVFLF